MSFGWLSSTGRWILSGALVGLGLQYLVFAGTGRVQPGPPWPLPDTSGVVSGLGILFVVVGVGIAARTAARSIALFAGVAMLIYAGARALPLLSHNLRDPNPWTNAFEIIALAGALVALRSNERKAWARAGELLFAAALVVFGVQHFLYAGYVASLIPDWFPARLALAYTTGGVFLAAAFAIATRIQDRLAAACVGFMFLAFVLLVHLRGLAAAPNDGNQWTSLLVAVAMMGAGFALVWDASKAA